MNQHLLYALWGFLFIICAGLGFIPEPEGSLSVFMTGLSLCFFLPPALLLHRAAKEQDAPTLRLIRNLAALWLLLALVLLVANFLTALASEMMGTVLYYILVIVTSPMICSGHWAMTMFFWACLLMVSLRELKRK